MVKITSKDNKLVKSIKKLSTDKKYRDSTNLFIGESYRVINTLINNKIKIRNLIVSNESRYFQIAKNWEKNGVEVVMLPKSIFNNLTSLTTSDGLIGIFIKPKDNFNFKPSGNYVVLDRIQNPGNLGSIIRTAVGFQLDGVIISNDSVDLYNPNIIRSTMGSCFAVPIKFVTSLTDVIKQLRSHKLKIYATAISSDAKKLNEISFPKNGVAIIFGNEGNGLKDDVIKMSDETIYIPINNKIDSLNVAVAVGIVLYKLCEQL